MEEVGLESHTLKNGRIGEHLFFRTHHGLSHLPVLGLCRRSCRLQFLGEETDQADEAREQRGRQSTKHRHKARGRLGTPVQPRSQLAVLGPGVPGAQVEQSSEGQCVLGRERKVPYKGSKEGPCDCVCERTWKYPQSIRAVRPEGEENNDQCHPMSLHTGPSTGTSSQEQWAVPGLGCVLHGDAPGPGEEGARKTEATKQAKVRVVTPPT